MQVRRRSLAWYLLPSIFNVVGGVVAYFVLRQDDPWMAKACLLVGVATVFVPVALFVISIWTLGQILPNIEPTIHDMIGEYKNPDFPSTP